MTPVQRIALASVFVLIGTLAARQVGSLDAGFHLAAGEHILDGKGWPRLDPFTYTLGDRPYTDMSWGYQVVIALLQRAGGAPGLVLFHAALVLTIFGLLVWTIRLVPADPLGLVVVLWLGALASEMRFEVRPELLSYAFLALVLYLLHRHEQGRRSPLALLPVLFLVWANCHSLFVLGWCALACFLGGLWLRDRRVDRRLLIAAAASIAVVCINPYGVRGALFPFSLATRLSRENVFGQTIGEFVSPFTLGLGAEQPFYPQLPIYAFRTLFVLVLVSLVPLVMKRRYASALLALPFLYLSMRMVRNMPLLVIAAGPGVVWALPLMAALGRFVRRPRHLRLVGASIAGAIVVASLTLALRTVHDAYYIATRRDDRFGLGWNRLILPLDAVAYSRDSGLRGRVLNHLNFGGYLMWARSEPVFIDGRLEVVGEIFYRFYVQTLSSQQELEACVARFGIRWMIFPFKTNPRLLDRMSHDPRWHLLYVDHVAAVFQRSDGADAVIAGPTARQAELAGAVPDPEVSDLPGLGGPPRPGPFARFAAGLVRRQHFPAGPMGQGLFHYFRGEQRAAAARFADAIRVSGGHYYETYSNLGAALYRVGRDREAEACYRIVLEDAPDNLLARERLAEIARRRSAPRP